MENIKTKIKNSFLEIWWDPCKLFPVLGFVFTSLVGTLLHFLPDVADNNFVSLFAPVNESVWEHLKLLFFPYLAFIAAEYFAYGKWTRGFLGAKMRGAVIGMSLIVSVHYVVSGIVGKDVMWVDVTLFFVGVLVAYLLPYIAIKRGATKNYSTLSAATVLALIFIAFAIFTFATPTLGIFMDPESGTYGIA